MQEPAFPLRAAYVSLLTGMTFRGRILPVYDSQATDDAVAPYLILGATLCRPDNTKDCFGWICEITLDIVTRFPGNARSRKPAEEIAALVLARIKPTITAEPLIVSGFSCYRTRLLQASDLVLPTAVDTVIRKLMVFENTLEESIS